MERRLKTRIIARMNGLADRFVPSPAVSTPPARGVRYFELAVRIQLFVGKVNTVKEGRRYKKHIVVRRTPAFGSRLFQLYTYHFPKHWSEGCIANRNLIKEAQRRAHALERDHSREALEWRTRFFKHYFCVFKGGAKPEPGLKPYSRFYQYVFVAIYRELQADIVKATNQQSAITNQQSAITNIQSPIGEAAEISFVPVTDRSFVPRPDFRPLRRKRVGMYALKKPAPPPPPPPPSLNRAVPL